MKKFFKIIAVILAFLTIIFMLADYLVSAIDLRLPMILMAISSLICYIITDNN